MQQFLQVNRHQGELWFNHEAFEELLHWMLTMAVIAIGSDRHRPPEAIAENIVACHDVVSTLQQAEKASEYQVAKLLELARSELRCPHQCSSRRSRPANGSP